MTAEGRTGTLKTVALTLIAPISWGTTYVTVTELLPAGKPLLVAAVRVVPAGILLLILGRMVSSWIPKGREWGQTIVLSLAYFGVFFPLLIIAVYRLPGGVAAAIGGTQPLLVALFGFLMVRVRPARIDLLVGLLAALGVAMVVLQPGAGLDMFGVLAALGANVSFAIGVVLTKKFPTPANRLAHTGWQMVISGLILVPLAVFAEGLPSSLSGEAVFGFVYLSVVATGVAFFLWLNGVRRLPVAAPPLLGIAAPVTAAILGWIILDQTFTPVQMLGLTLSLGAIAYGALVGTRRTTVR